MPQVKQDAAVDERYFEVFASASKNGPMGPFLGESVLQDDPDEHHADHRTILGPDPHVRHF